jgi:hypothetical protein
MARRVFDDPPVLPSGQKTAISIIEVHSGPRGLKGDKGDIATPEDIASLVLSNPPVGSHRVKNIYIRDNKLFIEYDDISS